MPGLASGAGEAKRRLQEEENPMPGRRARNQRRTPAAQRAERVKGRLDEQLDVSYDHFRIESTFLWISLPRTHLYMIHPYAMTRHDLACAVLCFCLCATLELVTGCIHQPGHWGA